MVWKGRPGGQRTDTNAGINDASVYTDGSILPGRKSAGILTEYGAFFLCFEQSGAYPKLPVSEWRLRLKQRY